MVSLFIKYLYENIIDKTNEARSYVSHSRFMNSSTILKEKVSMPRIHINNIEAGNERIPNVGMTRNDLHHEIELTEQRSGLRRSDE